MTLMQYDDDSGIGDGEDARFFHLYGLECSACLVPETTL